MKHEPELPKGDFKSKKAVELVNRICDARDAEVAKLESALHFIGTTIRRAGVSSEDRPLTPLVEMLMVVEKALLRSTEGKEGK